MAMQPGPRQVFNSKITRVQFKKANWIVCIVDLRVSGLVVMSVELTLPSQVIPFVAFDELPLEWYVAPHTITEEDLVDAEMVAPNVGFGVRNFPGTPLRGAVNGQLWLKLDDTLPNTPFPVTFHYTTNSENGSGDGELFYVVGVKGQPKIGDTLAGPNPVAMIPGVEEGQIISIESAVTETSDPERTFTFMFDPDTLIVSPATG